MGEGAFLCFKGEEYMNNYYPYSRPQVPATNISWVQGIEGAKAQQIQPGGSLLLLDSESDHFYIKVCDQYGICSPLKIYKFEEVVQPAPAAPQISSETAPAPDLSEYVKKSELEQLIKELKINNEQPVQSSRYVTTNNAKQQ